MSTRRFIPLLALAAACSAQPESPRALRVLIDTDLDRQLVELVSIDDALIRYIDASGRAVTVPAASFVAIAPAEAWHSQRHTHTITRAGVLELTDAQRLVGTPSVATAEDESLAWNHARLGLVSVPLESVKRLVMPRIMAPGQARPPLIAEADDALRLSNGDTLRGFVSAFGSDATIELDSGTVITTPMNVIDEMALANPTAQAEGLRLWLTGGNVLRVQEILAPSADSDPSRLTAILEKAPLTAINAPTTPSEADTAPTGLRFEIDLSAIEAVNFDAAALVPLASLKSTATDRTLTIDPFALAALDARDIHMPGPMTATWTLPREAARLSLTATLPMEARAWGDLELIISVDGSERERHTLSALSPEAHIRLELDSARELTIELDEGRHGPVQDRVVLREALLLLAR